MYALLDVSFRPFKMYLFQIRAPQKSVSGCSLVCTLRERIILFHPLLAENLFCRGAQAA
jgi:hypothetical protein